MISQGFCFALFFGGVLILLGYPAILVNASGRPIYLIELYLSEKFVWYVTIQSKIYNSCAQLYNFWES